MPIERASSGPGADEEAFVEAEVLETSVGYSGFFRLDVHRLRHRRFDGRMSEVITREVLERGNAVAVLPYDPRRDEVLLIRQFLPGSYFGGHPPRPLQIIAGMVGVGESEEDVARREAVEEAGCRIGRLERAHAFLPTPGGSSERVVVFCAEADLSSAGGVHGLAEEHEDIRVEVIPAGQAIRFLDESIIEAGPAVVGLAWFARHHDRIRREWLASPDRS
jgi:ADP-ribose pyrophosphatase